MQGIFLRPNRGSTEGRHDRIAPYIRYIFNNYSSCPNGLWVNSPFGSYFPSHFAFFLPSAPLFPHPCYGTRSPASLFLAMVHERNVREPLLRHSLRKARPCIMFTQNTHRNSCKFNWKFDKKILSHTHRFSDRNKIHNKKNRTTTRNKKERKK